MPAQLGTQPTQMCKWRRKPIQRLTEMRHHLLHTVAVARSRSRSVSVPVDVVLAGDGVPRVAAGEAGSTVRSVVPISKNMFSKDK